VRKVSDTTIRRLSLYLRILEKSESGEARTISSEELAAGAGTTAAQVRKDLSLFGSFGKRGLGYAVSELAERLRGILGVDRPWRVALVGAGRIGSALFHYAGFEQRGFRIVALFDRDRAKLGRHWGDLTVTDVSRLEEIVREQEIEMVVLAVPAEASQEVADRAVAAGVRGILNFAPVQLRVPAEVALEDVNVVMEMEALSFHITRGRTT
jgi:redox-sensing transcriptional repressor